MEDEENQSGENLPPANILKSDTGRLNIFLDWVRGNPKFGKKIVSIIESKLKEIPDDEPFCPELLLWDATVESDPEFAEMASEMMDVRTDSRLILE